MDFRARKCLLLIVVLFILCYCAESRFYEVKTDVQGWGTGLRQSNNVSLGVSGSAIGEGKYQRYTEMDFLEVRMRERIAAANGTLDTEERISLFADTTNDVEITLEKPPGGQDVIVTVNESWPVTIFAQRNIDYLGQGISDREIFGNNLDYVGSSYLRSSDLKKDRSCYLELQNAWFQGVLNDTTKTIVQDLFQPNKTTDYSLESRSQGQVLLKYRQSRDRITAKESEENYAGTFEIARQIQMVNYRVNNSWEANGLECCPSLPLEERIFGARSGDY